MKQGWSGVDNHKAASLKVLKGIIILSSVLLNIFEISPLQGGETK